MEIQDSTHSISRNAKRFFSGTLISRFTGLAREVAMAAFFGTDPVVAAFWMAFRFAHLLRRIFGEGSLHAAFVPHFEKLRKENPQVGARFFYDLSMGSALFLFLVTLAAEAVLGWVLFTGWSKPENVIVIRLTMIMLPALPFISLYAMNTSLLQCERIYFLPSAAPAAFNLLWLGTIFFTTRMPASKRIEYLAMMIVFAFALQWLVTLPNILRFLARELDAQWKNKRFSIGEILMIARPFALGLIGVAAVQINSALDAIFARGAHPEGPAYLWYAIRIQQLPLALVGISLTGALLPPIARAIQKNNQLQFLHFMNFAVRRAVALMVVMTGAFFVLGFSGINLVYGHGQFSDTSTLETTLCLWAYGLALLPMTLVLIFASAFYAHQNYKLPALFSLLSVGINIFLNALFIFIFHWGVVSVALATALAAGANGYCLALTLKKKYGFDSHGLSSIILKTLCFVTCAGTAVVLVSLLIFQQDNTFEWLKGSSLSFTKDFWMQLGVFGCQSLTFFTIFILAAYLFRIREIFDWMFSKRETSLLQ